MRGAFIVLLLVASLAAFPVSVIKQFPSTFLAGQTVQAEYHIIQNQSSQFKAFVKIPFPPTGINASMDETACSLVGDTFACPGYFGSGLNDLKLNLSFPGKYTGELSVWFELTPPPVIKNITIVPPVVTIPKNATPTKPTPPSAQPSIVQPTKPTPPVQKPVVVVSNADGNASANSTTNQNVRVAPILPDLDENTSLTVAALIAVVGGLVVWFL